MVMVFLLFFYDEAISLCNFICIVNNLNGRALVKTCALLLLPGKLGLNFSWLSAKENWLPRGEKLGNTGFVGAFQHLRVLFWSLQFKVEL